MSQYDNRNSGTLFVNDRKATDRHPDYNGTFTGPDGVEYWVSAWTKTSKTGKQFLSFSIGQPKEQQSGGYQASPVQANTLAGPAHVQVPVQKPAAESMAFDDDVPF